VAPATPTEKPIARRPGRNAWLLLLAVVVLGTAIDLASKTIAFNTLADAPVAIDRRAVIDATELQALLPRHEPTTIIPHVLDLQLVLNPGAVFGIGAGKRVFFIIATTLAIGFALWMFVRWTGPRDRLAHAAIGLVIAGGLGNLYDRVRFACVRDFLHPLPNVHYPFGISTPWSGREIWPYVSNLADLWLIIGVAILVAFLWRGPHATRGEASKSTPEPADAT
jgi:signal peptidase II